MDSGAGLRRNNAPLMAERQNSLLNAGKQSVAQHEPPCSTGGRFSGRLWLPARLWFVHVTRRHTQLGFVNGQFGLRSKARPRGRDAPQTRPITNVLVNLMDCRGPGRLVPCGLSVLPQGPAAHLYIYAGQTPSVPRDLRRNPLVERDAFARATAINEGKVCRQATSRLQVPTFYPKQTSLVKGPVAFSGRSWIRLTLCFLSGAGKVSFDHGQLSKSSRRRHAKRNDLAHCCRRRY